MSSFPLVQNNCLKVRSIRKLTRLFIQGPTFLAFHTSIISNLFQKNELMETNPFIHNVVEKVSE